MISREFLLQKLSPFANKKKLLAEYQDTDDIIKGLMNGHNKYKSEYDKIAKYFWQGNVKDTCNYIWQFLKRNVHYDVEPDHRQTIKSPSAILSTGRFRNGKNDCKHLSSFFGGIFGALQRKGVKIDWCYRFANYKLFSNVPHHVFVVCKHRGREIWCDAVLSGFDYKKPYINKIDKKMALYSISGIGCNDCYDDTFGAFGEVSIGRSRTERKAKRKAKRTARRSGVNCKGRTGAKIAMAVPRKAFLALIRLNVKKWAVHLHERMKNPVEEQKIMEKWCKLGGNAKLLRSAVEKAFAKYKRKHPNVSGIGVVATSTLLASATPIIVALLQFLKPTGSGASTMDDSNDTSGEQASDTGGEQGGDTIEGFTTKNLLTYGAVGVGLYFLYKKFK